MKEGTFVLIRKHVATLDKRFADSVETPYGGLDEHYNPIPGWVHYPENAGRIGQVAESREFADHEEHYVWFSDGPGCTYRTEELYPIYGREITMTDDEILALPTYEEVRAFFFPLELTIQDMYKLKPYEENFRYDMWSNSTRRACVRTFKVRIISGNQSDVDDLCKIWDSLVYGKENDPNVLHYTYKTKHNAHSVNGEWVDRKPLENNCWLFYYRSNRIKDGFVPHI